MHDLDIIKIVIGFVISWSVGLIPPIIIRYMILHRPIEKLSAIGMCVLFWIIIGIIMDSAIGSENNTHINLVLIAIVSYWILRQGAAEKIKTKQMLPPRPIPVGMSRGGLQSKAVFQASPAVLAQSSGVEWDILNQEFMECYRIGEYGRAEVAAKKAIEIAEKNVGQDHPDVAMILNNLADLYQIQGQYSHAEPLYRRSLAIMEKTLGPDHLNVAASLNNLAETCYAQGRFLQAEPLCKRSLSIMEKALDPDHPDVAVSLENLAVVYRAMLREKDAATLEKRAAAILTIKR